RIGMRNEIGWFVIRGAPRSSACISSSVSAIPYWKGLGAESEEKHEPASDIDTGVVDSLKALDLKRPIREADICSALAHVRFGPVHSWPRLRCQLTKWLASEMRLK